MSKQFNKKKYDSIYMNEHKSKFSTSLNKDELEEINKVFKQHEITKTDFIRHYFKKLKEELKMKRYIVSYEEEIMKNEKEGTYKYEEDHIDVYNTLEEARKAFNEFEGETYFNQTEKKWKKRIATLYETTVDEDNEFGDWEQIDAK